MSAEDLEIDLLAAFKQHYGLAKSAVDTVPDTRVLKGAQHVYNNAIDVFIDRSGTQNAAKFIHESMERKGYSISSWSAHDLHPRAEEFGEEQTIAFIFTVDLLNFSFWSDEDDPSHSFCIEYAGKRWTGYWSLIAAIRRALEEGISITSSDFWQCEEECDLKLLQHVFRSETREQMPLLEERLQSLRGAGKVLYERYNCSFRTCIEEARGSAVKLVNALAKNFDTFRDEVTFENEKVRFLKRAQILVADLWACFEGQGPGYFDDIDKITAFADYRMPQMLHTLGCLSFSPPLDNKLRRRLPIKSGDSFEVQLRGCSLWAIEMVRREIVGLNPTAKVNAILIDFFLYDLCKEREKLDVADQEDTIPHHRTRTICY